jgi:hypothetical protein
MLPNAHNLNHQIPEKAQAVKPKVTIALMLVSLFGLGVVILTFQAHATENTTTKLNLYAEKYVEQNGRNLKSLSQNPDTQLELSKNQEEDNTRMLEKGYDMMGSSTFVAPNTPSELAQQYGKDIKADIVLVYNKNVPLKTKIVKLDGDQNAAKATDEANKLTEQTLQTVHYASYWAKLPTPLFGVHIIKLIPAENKGVAKVAEVKGLTIIAVIKESPAAKASILRGDNLLKIGEMALDKPDDLFAAVKRYAGQTVPVELQRGEAVVKAIVTLNQRI